MQVFSCLVNTHDIEPSNVLIMSQYNAQRGLVQGRLEESGFENVCVQTVVASQGGERDYVILSLVRSLPHHQIDEKPSDGWKKKHLGFIIDEHQINVALTRAKKGLIIVGEFEKHLVYNDCGNYFYIVVCPMQETSTCYGVTTCGMHC